MLCVLTLFFPLLVLVVVSGIEWSLFSTISDLVLFTALSHECSFTYQALLLLGQNLQTIRLCLKKFLY